ncbi:bifunctional UDP-sugar hydrolase/5'-nucleotidase [Chelatococcus sp. SYSU_G07232]|uniref:Bifunctional UDP-sugar hydrolase/5'-nucleotidase n=1 Tax=Chelatococcus albus TaxID=3047466 RepID=A0ABT7AG40_9HYPH|nr:bifunctional UDP-sugar hydrolase/5'-nucleotidase [Chelatococcus sp. SYSU_G07232]MDJ1158323.1 bifunctional UDP-sugar hydrolase/5'-nucleotidase [Chelatococcus sp. SYSU_G07232]
MSDISRRQTLRLGLTAGLAAAALPREAQAQTPPATFTLLLVNDIYKMGEEKGKGGFARLAAIVKAERARGVPMLFVHAGDTLSPSLMSGFDQGAHIVALTNLVQPDVFVPGNHEFDFGKETYFKRLSEAKFPVFAANMRDAAGQPLPGHVDNRVFDLGGIKVGVVGLVLESVPQMSSPGDLKFLPVMDTLKAEARKLREQKADLVVAVTHTDRAVDNQIVRSRLVDVLLTGHDHDLAIGFDGKTVMVESNEEGNYVTAIDFTATVTGEGDKRQVTWTPTFRVNDSRAVTPDPEVLAVVKGYEAELSKELDVDVATLGAELDSRTTVVRSQEAAIGDLIADALRAATGADIAITNGGGIRANKQYPVGHKLTRRDILTELPFGNRTVMTEITGKDVRAALENGVSQYESRAGRFPQVSGLKVVFDPKQPAGSRIVSVSVTGKDGDKPLDDVATYKVATNDFMLRGGDGYTSFAKGVKGGDLDVQGKLMANDVMIYARKLGTINLKPEGRIVAK